MVTPRLVLLDSSQEKGTNSPAWHEGMFLHTIKYKIITSELHPMRFYNVLQVHLNDTIMKVFFSPALEMCFVSIQIATTTYTKFCL